LRRRSFALALPASAGAVETSVMGFGGLVTLNPWEEVLTVLPIEGAGAGIVGVAGAAHLDLPIRGLEIAAEVQLARYVGRQQSWEVNLVPAMIRWRPDTAPGPLASLAFGLGFSQASAPPAVEIRRGGDSSREKWYWVMEAGFAAARPDREIVLRLHHRSTGNGSIGFGGSTNAVVIGLRQQF
jgi:hypothetical protein